MTSFQIDTANLSKEEVERAVREASEHVPQGTPLHDHLIYAYQVLHQEHVVILFTELREEYHTIVFAGVLAHAFEWETDTNAIFDIQEVGARGVVAEFKEVFDGGRRYNWPVVSKSNDDLVEQLERLGLKGFVIQASHGMSGWILAGSMEVRRRDSKFRVHL